MHNKHHLLLAQIEALYNSGCENGEHVVVFVDSKNRPNLAPALEGTECLLEGGEIRSYGDDHVIFQERHWIDGDDPSEGTDVETTFVWFDEILALATVTFEKDSDLYDEATPFTIYQDHYDLENEIERCGWRVGLRL